MMLCHLGQPEVAADIQNAWLTTIEGGIHTPDIYDSQISKQCVGTRAFTQAVISNLGRVPQVLPSVAFAKTSRIVLPAYQRRPAQDKQLVGMDVFVQDGNTTPNEIAAKLQSIDGPTLKLSVITNRGIMVWPRGFEETFCTDHWRCRFETVAGMPVTKTDLRDLMARAEAAGLDTIKTENLYAFDGKIAFSLAQGH